MLVKMFGPGRESIWALIAWTIAGLLLVFFQRALMDAMWIAAGLVYVAYAGLGLLLLLAVAGYSIVNRSMTAALVCTGFVAVGVTMFYIGPQISGAGNTAIGFYRFYSNVDEYNKIVAEFAKAPPSELSGSFDDVRYVVDSGPPVRVAFPQPGGILDNWEGVVFDPTGEVEKAVGWTLRDGEQSFYGT